MELLIVAAVILTTLTAATIGSMKGRTVEGAFLGLFFSAFGVVAVAAMPPSDVVQRERDLALAKAVAEAMSVSTPREQPVGPAVELDVQAGSIDVPSVTVALEGCEGVASPTSTLTFSVEPGFVLIDACRDDCSDASHGLVLTAEEAVEACERIRIAASGDEGEQTTGAQNEDLLVDWSPGESDGTRTISFDWATKFLDAAAIERWDAGDRPDEADCGTLYLTGDLDLPGSEAARFESALSECAHLADEWEAGRANVGYVQASLKAFGTIVDL